MLLKGGEETIAQEFCTPKMLPELQCLITRWQFCFTDKVLCGFSVFFIYLVNLSFFQSSYENTSVSLLAKLLFSYIEIFFRFVKEDFLLYL